MVLIIGINCVFAQTSETEEINEELESIRAQISQLNDKQNQIIERLNGNEAYLGTVAKNINDALNAANTSFWYSSSLSNVIAVGLAMIGIIVSTWIGAIPAARQVGISGRYAWRLIGLGVIIGLLGFMLYDFIRITFGF